MILRILTALIVLSCVAISSAAEPRFKALHDSKTTSTGLEADYYGGIADVTRYDLSDGYSDLASPDDVHSFEYLAKSDDERARQVTSKDGFGITWNSYVHTAGRHAQGSLLNNRQTVFEGTASTRLELTIELIEETPFSITWTTEGDLLRDTFQNTETFAKATLRLLTGDTEVFSILHDPANLDRSSAQQVTLAPGTHKLIADVQAQTKAGYFHLPPFGSDMRAELTTALRLSPVPEPATYCLAMLAVCGLILVRRYSPI